MKRPKDTRAPIRQFRTNGLRAVIYQYQNGGGKSFTVLLTRTYEMDGRVHETQDLKPCDLPTAQALLKACWDWFISDQRDPGSPDDTAAD